MSNRVDRRTFMAGIAAAALAACSPDGSTQSSSTPSAGTSSTPSPSLSANLPSATTAVPQDPLRIPVLSREAWGALPARDGGLERHRPERLTLHHTEVLLERGSDPIARAQQHQRYHMTDPEHDYPDLAYHFMVDRQGNVLEGRDLSYRGDTMTNYDPSGHFLVCCEGDFDDQRPNRAMLRTTAGLFAWASQNFDIPPVVKGHRDYADTSCPGDALYRKVTDGTLNDLTVDLTAGLIQLDLLRGREGAAAARVVRAGQRLVV